MTELQTCRYSHGKCKLPRATKKNGTMHTLCEYHRTKACAHQKKLDAKRRNEKLRLLESKKAMQHTKNPSTNLGGMTELHMWKEDENRLPMNDTKYKHVWETQDTSIMYPPPTSHYNSQRDVYELQHNSNGYDDRYSKFPNPVRPSSPISHLRKDDSFRHHYGRESNYPVPSYPSPTSYTTSPYIDSNNGQSMHYDKQPLRHSIPHHMTTGPEFETRYNDYYEDPPYGRSTVFNQYPPQPVFHQ